MNKFTLETARVVGTSTRDSWSQIHLFSPEEKEKKSARGDLLAVLAVSGLGMETEAVTFGREIITRLHEEYYGRGEVPVLECLRAALVKIGDEFGARVAVAITAAVFCEPFLYLGVLGRGKVLFFRDGKLGEILTGEGEVDMVSGRLQDGDLFLLGTKEFFELTAEGVLRAALFSDSMEEIGETLAAMVHGKEESGAAAALIAKVNEEGKEAVGQDQAVREPKEENMPAGRERSGKKPFSGQMRLMAMNLILKITGGRKILKRPPGFFWENWLRSRLEKKRSARSLMTTVVLLVLILAISVGFGAAQRRRNESENEAEKVVALVEQKKNEAEAVLELNPSRARELIMEAERLIDETDASVRAFPPLAALEVEIKKIKNRVVREKTVEVGTFFDLQLIKQGASGAEMAVSGNKLYVLDRKLSSVYEIELETKKMAIAAGGKALENARHLAAFLPQVWVMTDREVLFYHRQTGREGVAVEAEDSQAVDLEAYGGNLYTLEASGIWQYPAVEGGLGERRNWLKEEGNDFSEVAAMAIDGAVWVTDGQGRIGRFDRGRRGSFGVAGLDYIFGKVVDLFTDENQENLYLLDSQGAVVVIGKSGEYQAAYLNDNLAGATGLVASEKAEKVWVLKEGKILEIDLIPD